MTRFSLFVLVHGAWHGSWCWEKVVPLLESAGHKVIAEDLPGHGNDKTPLKGTSLKLYTQSVVSLINQQQEPVILVGHSLGGMIITSVAEQIPDKISKLVYLTAYVPLNISLIRLAARDRDSQIRSAVQLKGWTVMIKRDAARALFYHDCPDEDVQRAKERLGPEPIPPVFRKIQVSDDRFGSVVKIYIKATEDQAISLQMQEYMCGSISFQKIIEMKTGHSPFYSAPEELSEHLLALI